jgi:putative methyltransferase
MNFYKQAADILDRLGKKEGSIKGLTLGNAEVTDKKRMYAVICETLKRKENRFFLFFYFIAIN